MEMLANPKMVPQKCCMCVPISLGEYLVGFCTLFQTICYVWQSINGIIWLIRREPDADDYDMEDEDDAEKYSNRVEKYYAVIHPWFTEWSFNKWMTEPFLEFCEEEDNLDKCADYYEKSAELYEDGRLPWMMGLICVLVMIMFAALMVVRTMAFFKKVIAGNSVPMKLALFVTYMKTWFGVVIVMIAMIVMAMLTLMPPRIFMMFIIKIVIYIVVDLHFVKVLQKDSMEM